MIEQEVVDAFVLAKLERERWEARERELRQQLLSAWPDERESLAVGPYHLGVVVRHTLDEKGHARLAALVDRRFVRTVEKVELGKLQPQDLTAPGAQELYDKGACRVLSVKMAHPDESEAATP